MKGSILDFSIQHNTGFISGDDNQRYSFNGADWRSERPPSRGDLGSILSSIPRVKHLRFI